MDDRKWVFGRAQMLTEGRRVADRKLYGVEDTLSGMNGFMGPTRYADV